MTLSEQTCDYMMCINFLLSLLAGLMGLQRITESLSLTQSKASPLPHWSLDNENIDLYDRSQWEDSNVHQSLHLSSCAKETIIYIYIAFINYIYYIIGIFLWLENI